MISLGVYLFPIIITGVFLAPKALLLFHDLLFFSKEANKGQVMNSDCKLGANS